MFIRYIVRRWQRDDPIGDEVREVGGGVLALLDVVERRARYLEAALCPLRATP